ncbi:MarR family transcriptional regulator [Psychrobacillus sp. FJAT-51614]|uniref:MarR family transcriptional regulator n=1 Tax=Psychrobacillus mangrovi TaxID=3117745 RepID=A0ABU8F729_9BACI
MMNNINNDFTAIYYYLHPENQVNISHQSVRILQFIQKEEGATVQDVAKTLQISPNTASEHIKKLERNGWVTKNRLKDDQRIVNINLTEEGLKIVKVNTELDSEKLSKVWATLTSEQKIEIESAFHILSEAAKHVYNH